MCNRASAMEAAFWTDTDDDAATLTRFRTLVHAIDDGLYQLDADGRFVGVNDAIVEVTGYPRDELLGERVSRIFEGDDIERVCGDRSADSNEDAFGEAEPASGEDVDLTIRTATGESRPCTVRVSRLPDGGRGPGAVGIVRERPERSEQSARPDRSERPKQSDRPERSEQSKRPESEQLERTPTETAVDEDRHVRESNPIDRILETSPVGIQVLDADGEIRRMNDRIREILDVPADEVDAYDPSERTVYDETGTEMSTAEHPFARAIETGEPVYEEVMQVELPTGDRRWLSVSASPIVDAAGEVDRVVTTGEDITALKERERTLETELEEIFGRVSDAFYAVDTAFRITHVNERAERLLQRSERELLGETLWDVFPANELDELRDVFRTVRDTQSSTSYERYNDALDMWVEMNLYPSESGISVYFRDITERKARERYLRDAKLQLEAATEAGAVGTWEWRLSEDEMVSGTTFAKTFGVDPDAAIEGVPSDRFLSSIHDADRERVEQRVAEALDSCGPYEAEYRVRNADDEIRWVVSRGRVESDANGNPKTFRGAATDITERKRAQLEAETQRKQLETLFRALPVGVMVANAEGKLLRVNETAKEIWEGDVFDAERVADYDRYTGWWERTGEPVEFDDWTMARVLEGEAVTDRDADVFEIETFDGNRRILMVQGLPIRDQDGTITRGVITQTDITERRRYERELERTIDQLEASNERLEHFAYAASHDLQEPLRMVSSYLQLIEDRYGDAFDEDGEEFLTFAIDGAERMREMIDGLLAYSRIETQGNPFEPTNLETIVDDVLADIQFQLEESEADVTIGDLPRVNGDAGQLRQLFQNLLRNAIEYSGDEPPQIEIDAERCGEEWTVSVGDDGIGIPSAEQERVFEVFQRLHSREEYEGTGIGLALCQRIVERHDGEIWVESEPDEGATFSFTLPAGAEFET